MSRTILRRGDGILITNQQICQSERAARYPFAAGICFRISWKNCLPINIEDLISEAKGRLPDFNTRGRKVVTQAVVSFWPSAIGRDSGLRSLHSLFELTLELTWSIQSYLHS